MLLKHKKKKNRLWDSVSTFSERRKCVSSITDLVSTIRKQRKEERNTETLPSQRIRNMCPAVLSRVVFVMEITRGNRK
jgi:hypothetical protein